MLAAEGTSSLQRDGWSDLSFWSFAKWRPRNHEALLSAFCSLRRRQSKTRAVTENSFEKLPGEENATRASGAWRSARLLTFA